MLEWNPSGAFAQMLFIKSVDFGNGSKLWPIREGYADIERGVVPCRFFYISLEIFVLMAFGICFLLEDLFSCVDALSLRKSSRHDSRMALVSLSAQEELYT